MADVTPMEQVLASSAQLTTWALAVSAGTIALIVGAYRRPKRLAWRVPYLLFLPGWSCIAYSVYSGNRLAGAYLASVIAPKNADLIGPKINDLYGAQLNYLLYGLAVFGLWLVIYLVGWMFSKDFHKEN